MLTQTPADQLIEMRACSDAVAFVRNGKFIDLQAAWDKCERGDWLLWFARKKSGEPESPERKRLVLAACECAREVLPIFEKRYPGDKRVRECIETTEQWARGENGVTIADVRAKRDAAADAAYAADAADAAAAAAAAYAAADAGYANAMGKRCADIVRKHYPQIP